MHQNFEQWLKRNYPKIHVLAKRQNVERFFEDEAGVRSNFHSGMT